MHRRSFIGGLLCAPVIVRTPGILMSIRVPNTDADTLRDLRRYYNHIAAAQRAAAVHAAQWLEEGIQIELNNIVGLSSRPPLLNADGTYYTVHTFKV